MFSLYFRQIVMTCGLFLLTFQLSAEPKISRSEVYGDWILQCFNVPVNEKTVQERCSLSQGVGTKEVKLIASVSVLLVGTKRDQSVLRLTLPLGLALSNKVMMAVDGVKQSKPLQWVTCVQGGCIADKPLSHLLLAALRKGKKLTVTAKTLNNQRDLIMKFSLAGFTKGQEAVK